MSSRLPPQEPAPPRRRADRPTAPAAAAAGVRAAGRAVGLWASEPRRRRAQRRARIALGQAVADHLTGGPAPPMLAMPLADHRAAQLRLASTDAPPRPQGRPTPGDTTATQPPGSGTAAEPQTPPARAPVASRASRSAGRHRDLAAELEWLLLIVVHFLPRLAARIRLRAADERLGAWATGLSDPQDPAVVAARERAAEVQRAAAAARVAASANWRQAGDAARLASRLASEAVADLIGWVGHGIRSGSSMVVAWLVSAAVAIRRRLRHGSAAAGRHVRAGSSVTREGLRTGTSATRESLRAGTAATREGLRAGSSATREGLRAGSAAAGRGVRGAGSGIAGAAGGLASRIDALADRGRGRRNGPAGFQTARIQEPATATAARTGRVRASSSSTRPIPSTPGGCRPAWRSGSRRRRHRPPAGGPGPTADGVPAAAAWPPACPAGWAGSAGRSGPSGRGSPRS